MSNADMFDRSRVPREGLAFVLKHYSGKGQLVRDLSQLGDDLVGEEEWSEGHVLRRAGRVLIERLSPLVVQLPADVAEFWNALPPQSERLVTETQHLTPRVDWTRSIRRFGWPLLSLLQSHRRRITETPHARLMFWVVGRLGALLEQQPSAVAAGHLERRQWAAVLEVGRGAPGASSDWSPTPEELRDLESEGHLWMLLCRIAEEFVRLDRDALHYAFAALLPDKELRGRLFQLAVAGCLLKGASEAGLSVTSVRPIGVGAGPQYKLAGHGRSVDLWIEASGAWGYYGWRSRYRHLCRRLPDAKPLSPDLLLTDGVSYAISGECKFYAPEYARTAIRDGVSQASCYLDELAATGSDLEILSFCVIPDVERPYWRFARGSPSGRVGLITPAGIRKVLPRLLPATRLQRPPDAWL